jgi:hypothetical protein
MSILRTDDLAARDLLALLQRLNPPAGENLRCWLDAPDGWALDYWPGWEGAVQWNGAGRAPSDEPLRDLLPRVTVGRIFAPSGELKWRRLPALGERCCRLVFLGEDWAPDSLAGLSKRDEELERLSPPKEMTYPLWGQQTQSTPGEWIDLRIPHRLRYPVKTETPARGRLIANVTVQIWKDRRGEPQFIRLCDMTARWEE